MKKFVHFDINDVETELSMKKLKDLTRYVADLANKEFNNNRYLTPKVYLFVAENYQDDVKSDTFITEDIEKIEDYINNFIAPLFNSLYSFYLFECSNYEDAFGLALEQKEANPLCYEAT